MSKKLSQTELRQMMQKLKTEKGAATGSSTRLKKYKLSTRELELIEVEKKRKAEEDTQERKRLARDAGVPENFFDSAKTKAFLNLNKAPQKSILKRGGGGSAAPPPQVIENMDAFFLFYLLKSVSPQPMMLNFYNLDFYR